MRPWAAELRQNLSVLDWCVERLGSRFPQHRLVLVMDPVDAERLSALSDRSYEVAVSSHWSDVDAWLDAAHQLGADEIVAARLEAALCPADVCAVLNDPLDQVGVAGCASLPVAIAPERVNAHAAAAIKRAVGNHKTGESFGDLFALAELARVDNIEGSPCKRLRVESRHSIVPSTRIAFESGLDIATLRRVVDGDGEPLDRWLADRAANVRHERVRATAPTPSAALRVLFVSNPSAVSGAESSTVELIGALRQNGVEAAALVAFEGDFTDRLRSVGGRVYCQDRDFLDDGIESWNLVQDAFADFQPDVVHYCGRSGQIPLHVAAAMKRPVVFHGHVPFPEPYRAAIGWANRYIAVSQSVTDAMIAAGLDAQAIALIPNGLNPASYAGVRDRRDALRQQLGLSPTAFVAITLARLSPEKRLIDVVEAISLARRNGHEVELVMAGEAHSSQTTLAQIADRIQDLELTLAVRMVGQVTDVRPLLGLADALVLCSAGEGLPMAALEAMAAGLPIIATEAGALGDLVGDEQAAGVCGLRVRPECPDDIATAMRRLQTQPDLWSALSREGQRLAFGPYSIAATADQMMQVYRDVSGVNASTA
jgi:glycosyltransferase involved in cell wall biosynthesis